MIKKAVAKIALGEFRGFQDDDEEKPIVKATIFLKNYNFFLQNITGQLVLRMLLLFQQSIRNMNILYTAGTYYIPSCRFFFSIC